MVRVDAGADARKIKFERLWVQIRASLPRLLQFSNAPLACLLGATMVLGFSGCGKSTQPGEPSASPPKPKEAASQLQQAFVAAEPELKDTATVASKALQTTDYDAAMQSLEAIKARGNLTFEQGMAVHNSMVALEGKLVEAADAGDPEAKRAYERLKKSRRD